MYIFPYRDIQLLRYDKMPKICLPPSPPYSHLFGLSSPLPLQRSKLNLNSPYHHYLHHHFSQKEYPKFTGIQMVLIIRYGLLISLLILTKYKQID